MWMLPPRAYSEDFRCNPDFWHQLMETGKHWPTSAPTKKILQEGKDEQKTL